MGASKPAGNILQLMITSLSLSKFSVVLCPFVLGDNRTFSFFCDVPKHGC